MSVEKAKNSIEACLRCLNGLRKEMEKSESIEMVDPRLRIAFISRDLERALNEIDKSNC